MQIISPRVAVHSSLRIGSHLGDVIVGQDGDLYGGRIQHCCRLEGISDPGGILIPKRSTAKSKAAGRWLSRIAASSSSRNIAKPVRAYAVLLEV